MYLKTVQESNDRGTWFGWNITNLGPISEEDMFFYEAAKDFALSVGEVNLSSNSGEASTEDAPF